MMGRSHALSGAVGWLAGCASLTAIEVAVPSTIIVAGAFVSAGFALLPDLDHEGSTVSRTLGPITGFLSGLTAASSVAVRASSCRHCASTTDGGHRGLTHTAAGALAMGLLVTACALLWPHVTAWTVIGFGVWLAAHTALSSRLRARIGDMVLPGRFRRRGRLPFRVTAGVGALLIAVLAAAMLVGPVAGGWWWLGLPVFWGCLAHTLGDALTFSRVPLLWPLQIRGCRWTPVGTPRWMRFRTGSTTEKVVVGVMAVAGGAAVYMLAVGG
ncbi:MAG TPA: metal-dependent hydrolase [Candidatus Dormibacteraeota bacterium]|jgi:membrane-bound metal-dependent hydrolase YbcI (DUF457 family)